MTFSEQKGSELTDKLLELFTKAVLEARQTKNMAILDEPAWYKRVYEANLVEGDKQLFLLGTLAQKVHDLAPQAMKDALDLLKK